MKKIIVTIVLFLFAQSAFAQNDTLQNYLATGDYFHLKKYIEKNFRSMNKERWFYYKCFVDNAFGKFERSITETNLFISGNYKGFSEEEMGLLKAMNAYNYNNTFQYKKAADAATEVIARYSTSLSPGKLKDLEDDNLIFQALASVPPQVLAQHGDITIPIKKDKVGLWRLPASTSKGKEDFIFDTGAGISTVSETGAKKLGIRKLSNPVKTEGINGNEIKCSIGVADSLVLGDKLKVKNVIFYILPDEQMHAGDYDFSYVLGFPVIMALKEVQLSKNGTLKIPAKPSRSIHRNLAIDQSSPRILIATDDNDSLILTLDTGADVTDLYAPFFVKYKDLVVKNGERSVDTVFGADGKKEASVYEMKDFRFRIGFNKGVLNPVRVRTQAIKPTSSKELIWGNLGEDAIAQYETVIINFDDMFVEAK